MQKAIDEALATAREQSKPGDRIAVARYADEKSLRFFRPFEEQTFEQYSQLITATVAALRKEGFDAREAEISQEEYKKWLGSDLNTEFERARFVAIRLKEKQ